LWVEGWGADLEVSEGLCTGCGLSSVVVATQVQANTALAINICTYCTHSTSNHRNPQAVVRDRRANWAQSIGVLQAAKAAGAKLIKTSIMLGCGETHDEVVQTLRELREAGARFCLKSTAHCQTVLLRPLRSHGACSFPRHRCLTTAALQTPSFTPPGVDVVTLGQYMRPTKRHMAVSEYVTPAAFAAYQAVAESLGFTYVASGPMVRSSYRAGEFYLKNVLQERERAAATA